MKIRFMSDLHMEFAGACLYLPEELETDSESTLVLAGDICNNRLNLESFMHDMSKRFRYVIFVMGNHEYYGKKFPSEYERKRAFVLAKAPNKNIHFLNNCNITLDGVNFTGGTLWTNFRNHNIMDMEFARLQMNDYKCIRNDQNYRKITPAQTASAHAATANFIFNSLKRKEKNVVVTHHGPSYRSVPMIFKGDVLNSAYVTEYTEAVMELEECLQPELWIHAHTHNNMDYMLTDKTRVVCNPRGYQESISDAHQNQNFREDWVIDL